MVSMETEFSSQDWILEKLSEKFTWVDSEKGNMVFAKGGALCAPPPPLPTRAPKKPALDRVKHFAGILWSMPTRVALAKKNTWP